jgi:cell division protein FtsQ
MSLYQGRALRTDAPRRRQGRLRRIAIGLAVIGVVTAVAHVPPSVRQHLFDARDFRVEGLRYLSADEVVKSAGLSRGEDLWRVDPALVRQRLLLQPRISSAHVARRFPHGVTLSIEERQPVLLVQHGEPWELDTSGVLLPPLADGVVADVPMLVGPSLQRLAPGTQVRSPAIERGLAWVRALGQRELQLGGQVSELDVSDPRSTLLTLLSGTRVLSPAWPPDTRALSALRVVLADLHQRGTLAQEVDLRFENQVIVRPAVHPPGARTS